MRVDKRDNRRSASRGGDSECELRRESRKEIVEKECE